MCLKEPLDGAYGSRQIHALCKCRHWLDPAIHTLHHRLAVLQGSLPAWDILRVMHCLIADLLALLSREPTAFLHEVKGSIFGTLSSCQLVTGWELALIW